MTDREIQVLKDQVKLGDIYWQDRQDQKLYKVHKIVGGNQVYTAPTEGPEPCECATFEDTSMYICLDNVELGEFFQLEMICM